MKHSPYTKINNTLLENALCKITLSSYEWRVMMFVIRQTSGWNRKEFNTSYRAMAEATVPDWPLPEDLLIKKALRTEFCGV